MAETRITGLPQLNVDAVLMLQLLLFGLRRAGWRLSSYSTTKWQAWEHKPSCSKQEMVLCKKPRNTAKHVALPFAQNNAPGGAEHIAGHCDLPRNLGEGSSASKAELCPRLSLLNSGATGSGGQQILPGSKSERPFLPEWRAGPATASSQPPPASNAYKSQRSSWKNLLQMILQHQSNTEKYFF